jgi:simple sugar transport system substrate-binding protein
MLFLKGALPFGRAEVAGVRDGYVDFVEDDPNYTASVSQEIREQQAAMLARIRSGALRLDN